MICDPCRDGGHDHCPGRDWCDCQHADPAQVVTDTPHHASE